MAVQLLLLLTGDPSVQVVPGLLKPPPASVEKVTVPVGAVPPEPELSLTVAVQVMPWPAVTGVPQFTEVIVARLPTVIVVEAVLKKDGATVS